MSDPNIQAAAEAVAPTVRRITAKEFLALPKDMRPKVLREKLVTVHLNDEVELGVTVRQLTKTQTSLLNQRVLNAMPAVPTVEQTYDTVHTDPATGKARRPGKYAEPNPEDPRYKQELEVWFNEACVWMALLSASEDLGVTPENLEERFNEVGDEFPATALLSIAIEAAKVNEGLNLADQLLQQVRTNEAIMEQIRAMNALQEDIDLLATQDEGKQDTEELPPAEPLTEE